MILRVQDFSGGDVAKIELELEVEPNNVAHCYSLMIKL